MSAACKVEQLEALLEGALATSDAVKLELHLPLCAECTRELAWLRTERGLMIARRQSAPKISPKLWLGVQARLAETREPMRRWFTTRGRWLELVTAFAVVVLVVIPVAGGRPTGAIRTSDSHERGALMCPVNESAPLSWDAFSFSTSSSEDALTCPVATASIAPARMSVP